MEPLDVDLTVVEALVGSAIGSLYSKLEEERTYRLQRVISHTTALYAYVYMVNVNTISEFTLAVTVNV